MGEVGMVEVTELARITSEDVRWDYNGQFEFEVEPALAVLLKHEVVFLNNHWWRKDMSEEDQRRISVNVNCSDVFAWGCADAEALPYGEIQKLYELWEKDRDWGPAVWCIQRRKHMPQRPVATILEGRGYDLAALIAATSETTDQPAQ